MKRLILITIFAATLANAGIVHANIAGAAKVATYPVRHPVKAVKALGHVVKVVLW